MSGTIGRPPLFRSPRNGGVSCPKVAVSCDGALIWKDEDIPRIEYRPVLQHLHRQTTRSKRPHRRKTAESYKLIAVEETTLHGGKGSSTDASLHRVTGVL